MTEGKARIGNSVLPPFPAFEWNGSRMGKMRPDLTEVNKITEKVKLKKTLISPLERDGGLPPAVLIRFSGIDLKHRETVQRKPRSSSWQAILVWQGKLKKDANVYGTSDRRR
jgi:hypothetical protein